VIETLNRVCFANTLLLKLQTDFALHLTLSLKLLTEFALHFTIVELLTEFTNKFLFLNNFSFPNHAYGVCYKTSLSIIFDNLMPIILQSDALPTDLLLG
jgi:hypothetical protein